MHVIIVLVDCALENRRFEHTVVYYGRVRNMKNRPLRIDLSIFFTYQARCQIEKAGLQPTPCSRNLSKYLEVM